MAGSTCLHLDRNLIILRITSWYRKLFENRFLCNIVFELIVGIDMRFGLHSVSKFRLCDVCKCNRREDLMSCHSLVSYSQMNILLIIKTKYYCCTFDCPMCIIIVILESKLWFYFLQSACCYWDVGGMKGQSDSVCWYELTQWALCWKWMTEMRMIIKVVKNKCT